MRSSTASTCSVSADAGERRVLGRHAGGRVERGAQPIELLGDLASSTCVAVPSRMLAAVNCARPA